MNGLENAKHLWRCCLQAFAAGMAPDATAAPRLLNHGSLLRVYLGRYRRPR
ncbi:MAG: hypothetical protein IT368_14925 [Candidatus Hydrogenedentes bacterium]|nr:hypothetical protein [Candidatus Hydrogenedentota bacterium]